MSNVIDFVKYKAEREMKEWMEEVEAIMRGMGISTANPQFWYDAKGEDERDSGSGSDGTVRPDVRLCSDTDEPQEDEDT